MRLIKKIPILLCGLIMLTGCVKEELSSGSVAEGKPTLIKFSLNASYKNESRSTRVVITEADEKKFADIRVLIFDSKGTVVTNKKVSYPEATATPDLTIESYSGNNRTIYVVANAVTALDTRLAAVTTKAELLTMQTTIAESELGAGGKPLLMTAVEENFSIQPGSSHLSLQMAFMAAKVTLVVKDNSPDGHSVTILGWDVLNSASNSYVIPEAGKKDANADKLDEDNVWETTTGSKAFDNTDDNPAKPGKKITTLTQYLFENRRGVRVDHLPLPASKYPGMKVDDGEEKGKAWFAPKRATAIVIHATYKANGTSRAIEATIFIGNNKIDNYDIERGTEYIFTVTVSGIGDINIDTNLDPVNKNFVVKTSAPLDQMDAHPDFRPFMISADNGAATIEILDMSDRTYNHPAFDAKWVKVSPLNLMYHQVRQVAPNDEWQQQAGVVGSFVRAKYIPHKSVRETLTTAGIRGWNQILPGQDNDDVMTFADATYRMCYQITDIPFAAGAVTSKTLCVYTDDYNVKNGSRSAKVKVSFKPTGSPGIDERTFTITQNGYLSIFDESDPDAGLAVYNVAGVSSNEKTRFGIEQFEEVTMKMNPNIAAGVQSTREMQYGFFDLRPAPLYAGADRFRNGYYLTANAVYTDVTRTNNQPSGFGVGANSYRPMYGNGKIDGTGVIPPYTGATTAPYYYPVATDVIYHPIYKSSAARYCHEKNRDLNGDGIIDASETHWYLPALHELYMVWVGGVVLSISQSKSYWGVTEYVDDDGNSSSSWVMMGSTALVNSTAKNKNNGLVRCIRKL